MFSQLHPALADEDCILTDYYNILPTDYYLLTPAQEAAYASTTEDGYTHKATCTGVYFHVADTTKTASVINVYNLF